MFVVLDGVDGCGKTTQAERLARALPGPAGTETLHLREPGSTEIGESLRRILLAPGARISAAVEALLFTAARRQMLDEIVAPALARGAHVVVERFHAATFAYQGYAGGLGEEVVLDLLERFAGFPRPDLVILLDVAPEVARRRRVRERAAIGPAEEDRIESRGLEFQVRVAEGFRRYSRRAANVVVVDAAGSEDEVAAAVLAEVRRAM